MTFRRLLLGLKSLRRVTEIGSYLKLSRAPLRETLAYLQLIKLKYPHVLKMRDGVILELNDWQDLTTAQVVFYGNEYALRTEDRIIVDCGANIGAFSLLCAARLPKAKIIAIEPFPSTYDRLIRSIGANGAEAQINVMNGAVVGKAGSVFMDDSPDVASHSRKVGGSAGVAVEGYTLDRILTDNNLKDVDLLKVDIEGAEYSLFEETPGPVLRCFKSIGLEYHGNGDSEALFKCIESAGFSRGRYPKKGICGVVEFIRKDRLES